MWRELTIDDLKMADQVLESLDLPPEADVRGIRALLWTLWFPRLNASKDPLAQAWTGQTVSALTETANSVLSSDKARLLDSFATRAQIKLLEGGHLIKDGGVYELVDET